MQKRFVVGPDTRLHIGGRELLPGDVIDLTSEEAERLRAGGVPLSPHVHAHMGQDQDDAKLKHLTRPAKDHK